MGNNRNLLVLVGVLLVLGGLYFYTNRQRDYIDTTGGVRDLVEGTLSTNEVFGIEVYKGTDPQQGFTLAKRGDDWVMTSKDDAPANVNKIRTLLGNLENLRGEFRSDDPAVLDDYALADSSALHVIVKNESGQELVNLLVGSRSGSGGFVRENGSNDVLLADHNLLGDFGVWGEEIAAPATSNWIDLVAFSVTKEDVRNIELHVGGKVIALEKEFAAAVPDTSAAADTTAVAATPPPTEYEWRVTEPESFLAMKSRADGILNSLSSLRARDLVGRGAQEEQGLGEDADRVLVTTEDGTVHTLLFGAVFPDDENQLYFQVAGQDLVWAMPNYLKTNVFKTLDDLRPASN